MNIIKVQNLILEKSIPEPNCGCWFWLDCLAYGYGTIFIDGVNYRAHRISYEAFKGKPKHQVIRHQCNMPSCVNPDHLIDGTYKENKEDQSRLLLKRRRERDPAYKWWIK